MSANNEGPPKPGRGAVTLRRCLHLPGCLLESTESTESKPSARNQEIKFWSLSYNSISHCMSESQLIHMSAVVLYYT